MNDETWQGVIIWPIPPTVKWLPVIPSLYAMSSSADIISTLFTHGMIIGRDTKMNGSSSNTVLVAWTNKGCTNPNCKAKKCSTHSMANCYWPGGGKEGQFPANFGQKNQANAVTSGSMTSQPKHCVLTQSFYKSASQSELHEFPERKGTVASKTAPMFVHSSKIQTLCFNEWMNF